MNEQPKPQRPPDPSHQFSHHARYQLSHTMCSLLPPPLADTPEAMLARNDAAIGKVADMAPVNDDEADIAAHCVCARARAEEALRLLQGCGSDISLTIRLGSQYALMERTGIALRNQLHRLQTARRKRENSVELCDADEWTRHVVRRELQQALQQGPMPAVVDTLAPAVEVAAQVVAPVEATPAAMPVLRHSSVAPPPPRPTERRQDDEDLPERDVKAEADQYGLIYPYRAGPIRKHGRIPPGSTYGPPDDELLYAIIHGTSAILRALDEQVRQHALTRAPWRSGACPGTAGAAGGWHIELEGRRDAEIAKQKAWRSLRLCVLLI